MKIILISLLCLIMIGITSYSYAQYTTVDLDTKVPEVLLQLQLRDSDGNFITYIEAEQIIGIDRLKLNEFFDNQNQKFLIKDGKAYEIIQWQGETDVFDKKHAYSGYDLWVPKQNEFAIAMTIRHNSYQTQPGDTLTVYWTIIRPAS